MKVLINQPAGLGDIIFCQKIAVLEMQKGNSVYWPLLPQLSYIKDYIKNGIIWENCEKPDRVIDLENASKILHETSKDKIMSSKYEYAGFTMPDWCDYFQYCENEEKINSEEINPKGRYAVVLNTFGTPPGIYRRPIEINISLPKYNVFILDGFTPFDYRKTFENAEEIHIVDTCFTLLCEKWDTSKIKKMCLYPRIGFETKIITKNILKKPWMFCD